MQSSEPGMWVQSQQYSGRIVTVTSSKTFDEPVYNYTRDFSYIWEEMQIPISYSADRVKAENILLGAAGKQRVDIANMAQMDLQKLEHRYLIEGAGLNRSLYSPDRQLG